MIPNFYHCSDPQVANNKGRHWAFVYLHGEAEALNQAVADKNEDWYDWAPDLFESDQDMPSEPGEYSAMLYGKEVVVVLAYRGSNILCGRAVLADDSVALEHARCPSEWR